MDPRAMFIKQEVSISSSSDDESSLGNSPTPILYNPFAFHPQTELHSPPPNPWSQHYQPPPNEWFESQQKVDNWMETIDVRDLCVQDEVTEHRLQLELLLNQLRKEANEKRASSIDYGMTTMPSPTTSEYEMFTDNMFTSDTKVRLYEFVLQLLEEDTHDCIRWICPVEGEFEITNSAKIAFLWGQVKRNPNMTYEKFARALRHYYKLGILINYKHKEKLRYKFSKDILKKNKLNK